MFKRKSSKRKRKSNRRFGTIIKFIKYKGDPNNLSSEELEKIKELNCFGCRLDKLPNGMINLRILYCGSNRLTKLPNDIVNIKKLECFDNYIEKLPNGLTQLEILECYTNNLKKLPNDMVKLKKLRCSGNQLTEIPYGLNKLELLDCYGNKLTMLPYDMTNLKHLECWSNPELQKIGIHDIASYREIANKQRNLVLLTKHIVGRKKLPIELIKKLKDMF